MCPRFFLCSRNQSFQFKVTQPLLDLNMVNLRRTLSSHPLSFPSHSKVLLWTVAGVSLASGGRPDLRAVLCTDRLHRSVPHPVRSSPFITLLQLLTSRCRHSASSLWNPSPGSLEPASLCPATSAAIVGAVETSWMSSATTLERTESCGIPRRGPHSVNLDFIHPAITIPQPRAGLVFGLQTRKREAQCLLPLELFHSVHSFNSQSQPLPP